jgi:hypothetical protein
VFSLSLERATKRFIRATFAANCELGSRRGTNLPSRHERRKVLPSPRHRAAQIQSPRPRECAMDIHTGKCRGSNEIILSRQPRDYENGLRALQAQCNVITTGKVTSAGEKQTRTARRKDAARRTSHLNPFMLRTFSLGEVNSLTFTLC